MKAQIVINLDGTTTAIQEYLDWWRENEDSNNAYTEGPMESMEDPDSGTIHIECTYWTENQDFYTRRKIT